MACVLIVLGALLLSSPVYAAAILEADPTSSSPTADISDVSGEADVNDPSSQPEVGTEVIEKRTANSRDFLLSDGSHRLEVFLDPIHYQDAEGSWQPIDTTVGPSSKEGFAYENSTNAFRSYFVDEEGRAGTIRVEDGPFSLELSPMGAAGSARAALVLDGAAASKVEYGNLFDETTARYSVLGGTVKEQLILASAKAPTMFRYQIEAVGLEPLAQEDGSIAFIDKEGETRFVLARPFAEDSAAEPAYLDLSQSITPEGSCYLLEISLDEKWFADPARVFPVTIDPTVTGSCSQATYIDSSYPTKSYGASSGCLVKQAGAIESLVKFTLPTISGSPGIQQAYMSLVFYQWETGSGSIRTYRITSTWSESVTWNTRPSRVPDSEYDSETSIPTSGSCSLDITSSARKWYSGTENYGVQLISAPAPQDAGRKFYSDEYSDSYKRPKLTILYTYEDTHHTTYDLGELAGHQVRAALDETSLEMDVCDLSIASCGPPAQVSRHYTSTNGDDGYFATGWRFNFERNLVFVNSTLTRYVDEAGEEHAFTKSGGVWQPPTGYIATLADLGSTWALTLKGGTVLTFNTYGKLMSETDRNGNATTYTWASGDLTITAANGQQITVNCNGQDPEIVSATHTTAAGTRTVTYGMEIFPLRYTVAYLSGDLWHRVSYKYDFFLFAWRSAITEMRAEDFYGAGFDAVETYAYAIDCILERVRLPDYASSVPNYNNSNSDAQITFGLESGSCTVTRWGAVRTSSVPTGATGTAVTQVYRWNVDASSDVTSRTNPKLSGEADQLWTYTFTPGTGWLLSETSPLGKTRSWTYDDRGNILTETDELGHQTTYTYPTSDSDPNRDLPLTVTDPRGAVTTYTYDSSGNVTHVTRTLNQNPTDNLAETMYTYGNVTVGSATCRGALIQEQKLVSGSSWAVTDYNTDVYYPNGAPKKTVYRNVALAQGGTPVDLTVTTTYDAFGNLLTKTDTSGQVVETNVYDLCGRLIQSTSAPFTATVGGSPVTTQVVVHNTYDVWGHLTETYKTSTADASGCKADWATTTYDATGRPSQVKHWLWTPAVPAGQVQSTVTYRYDGMGREISLADTTASGQPALKAYDAIGNVVVSWPAGVASYADSKAKRNLMPDGSSAYDAVGNLLRTIAPGDSSAFTFTYTDDGRPDRTTAPDGSWIECEYNAGGNLIGSVASNEATTNSAYDLGGRLVSETSQRGLTTCFAYDCLGRPVSAQASGQPATQGSYNVLGWSLWTADADGVETTLVYDQAGRVIQGTTAGNTTSTTYDTAGSVTRVVDPADKWTEFAHDYFGRTNRESRSNPDAGSGREITRDIVVTYDSLGRITASADNVVQITHALSYPLNTAGTVTDLLTVGSGGSQVQTTISVGADGLEASRQTSVASSPQIPSLLRTVNARDDAQRITRTTLDAGSGSIVAQYLFDSAGRLQRQWGATGGGSGYTSSAESTDAYTYDASSGLKTADNINLASVDTAGAIVSTYGYSSDGRLTSATTGGVSCSYGYSTLGNLTTITPQGGDQTTLTYDSAGRLQNAVTGADTTYFSWDTANGRRTSQGSTSNELDPRIRYTYTGTSRLSTYTDETRSPSVSASYSYDSTGQRRQSAVTVGAQTTTSDFLYQDLNLMSLSASQSGGAVNDSWRIDYLYDAAGRGYAGVYREPDTSTSPVPFGMVTTDRGDVVALLDAAGTLFAAYRYDAWGNPQGSGNVGTGVWVQSTALIGETLATDIALRQPLRYAGYYFDSESGLYYLAARSYDPRTAQFLSKDPIDSDGEESPYQYCGGNPVSFVDPSGLLTLEELFGGISAGFVRLFDLGSPLGGLVRGLERSLDGIKARASSIPGGGRHRTLRELLREGAGERCLEWALMALESGDIERAASLYADYLRYGGVYMSTQEVLAEWDNYRENGPEPGDQVGDDASSIEACWWNPFGWHRIATYYASEEDLAGLGWKAIRATVKAGLAAVCGFAGSGWVTGALVQLIEAGAWEALAHNGIRATLSYRVIPPAVKLKVDSISVSMSLVSVPW